MSAVQILESKSAIYTNLGGRYFFVELASGKHKLTATIAPTYLQVIVQNASNRAWRGMGRRFKDLEEALAYYKTPEIQAMLRAAIAANIEDAIGKNKPAQWFDVGMAGGAVRA